MATREEILETKGEIRKLNVAIEGLETQLKETSDKDVKKNLGDQISQKTALMIAKQNTLTALITAQQGNFSHVFPLSFPNLLDVILCPNLFRHLLQSHPGSAVPRGKMRYNWTLLWFADTDDVFLCFAFSI